jgi:polyisoprenoid-binding protein YceI
MKSKLNDKKTSVISNLIGDPVAHVNAPHDLYARKCSRWIPALVGMTIKVFILFFLATPSQATDNVAAYYVAPPQFNATLQIMDSGFANLTALFRNGTGSFTFDESAKTISNVKLAIDATSLLASNAENQRDLGNLLGAFSFSEIRIVAPDATTFKDNKADLKATVTVHGVIKAITFEATLNKTGKAKANGSWGAQSEAAGLSLRGQIKRADFGMEDDPALPSRYGESISLMIDVTAIRQ